MSPPAGHPSGADVTVLSPIIVCLQGLFQRCLGLVAGFRPLPLHAFGDCFVPPASAAGSGFSLKASWLAY